MSHSRYTVGVGGGGGGGGHDCVVHLPSFIIMELITTEKRARAIVYAGHKDILNYINLGEIAAVLGLSALFRMISFYRKTAITILQVMQK